MTEINQSSSRGEHANGLSLRERAVGFLTGLPVLGHVAELLHDATKGDLEGVYLPDGSSTDLHGHTD